MHLLPLALYLAFIRPAYTLLLSIGPYFEYVAIYDWTSLFCFFCARWKWPTVYSSWPSRPPSSLQHPSLIFVVTVLGVIALRLFLHYLTPINSRVLDGEYLLWEVVSPAVREELLFRGVLLHLLLRSGSHWGVAIVLNGLLFACAHQYVDSYTHYVMLTLSGTLYALSYIATGRLLVPVLLHALWNLAPVIAFVAKMQ